MNDAEYLELEFLFDRFVHARRTGRWIIAEAYSRCMQQVLEAIYPVIASALRSAASKKGVGVALSKRIASNVDAKGAAVIALVLILRRSRGCIIAGITENFHNDAAFLATQSSLSRSLFHVDAIGGRHRTSAR